MAEEGHLLMAADYPRIELRLMAHFSQDRLLLEAFRRGEDIHTLTAAQVFGVRRLMVTSDAPREGGELRDRVWFLGRLGWRRSWGLSRR